MAKREEYLNNIRRQLSVLKEEVRLNNRVNRQGLNISCEDILGGLLNLMYDWQLSNTNDGRQNYPAIDLADWEEGVVVQVSSDTSGTKIKETLAKLQGPAFADARIRKLIMLFLAPKLKYTTVFEHEGFELELMDLDDISRSVEHLTAKKLREISDYLDEELGRLTAPPEKPQYLLPGVPTPTPSFVEGSRDRELELLEQALERGPVFLWGLGGIGKTETAIQLAKRCAPPKGAYFLHYYHDAPDGVEALRETILRANFAGYRFEGWDNENRDLEYRERMDILRTEFAGTMVIIDNFDRPGKTLADLRGEPAYRDLTAMDIRLVFTTRNEVPLGGVEIRSLTEAELLKLMRQSCTSRAVSDEDLLALIRAVEGHTLMADLMAKTLAESWGGVTARGILDALKNSELDQEDFPEVVADRNREERQRKLYAHLKALFDLSGMSEEDRSILRCATLLPEDGMRDRLFMDCLPREQRQPLRNLTKRGWLHHEGENLTIHPVIREVCREELEPTDETCEDFIAQLYNRHDISRIYDADRFLEMAKCFSIASERLTDTMGNYAFYASLFWHKLGLTQKAQQFELRAVEQRERNLPPDSEGLAVTYNNMAMVCCALGNQDMALQYQKRMLAICEKQFSVDHPVVAISYNNLGYIYSAQGDYLKALEYHLKAQAIYEKALPEYIIWLAVSYGNVGMTYCLLGSPGKGLEYNLKALAILEKEGVSDHPDFAKALNNVGFAYGLLGKHDKAMEYYRKAVEIGERLLPTDHSELANYYYNVGVTYFELGECCRAMEYLEKALAIYEKSLPPDHPYIASTKESIGNVRSRL